MVWKSCYHGMVELSLVHSHSFLSLLRLNEGFATWIGWMAVDRFFPEWDIWTKFTSECLQTALTIDSLKNSHPIEVDVSDTLKIAQIFDEISYLKGSSCIRMLSTHLGTDTFLRVCQVEYCLLIFGSRPLFKETRVR